MRVIVTGFEGIEALQHDLENLPAKAIRDIRSALSEGAKAGNLLAKDSARVSAGEHGKLYPRAFRVDSPKVALVFGQIGGTVEYGPVSAFPQGGMEFEEGSRNQPPHRDLAKSSPQAIGLVAQELRKAMDGWFW